MSPFSEAKKIHTILNRLQNREEVVHNNVKLRYKLKKQEILDSASDAAKKLLSSIIEESGYNISEPDLESESEDEEPNYKETDEKEEPEDTEEEGSITPKPKRRRMRRKGP